MKTKVFELTTFGIILGVISLLCVVIGGSHDSKQSVFILGFGSGVFIAAIVPAIFGAVVFKEALR
jgi:VIT1/CCC1 family predicted Fe2+/Mn2+ transporter